MSIGLNSILAPPIVPPQEFTVPVPRADGTALLIKVITSKLPDAPNHLYQCFVHEEGQAYRMPFLEVISWPSVDDLRTALLKTAPAEKK